MSAKNFKAEKHRSSTGGDDDDDVNDSTSSTTRPTKRQRGKDGAAVTTATAAAASAAPSTKRKSPRKQKEDVVGEHESFSITFGDQAENHAGMQKIGTAAQRGFTVAELRAVAAAASGPVNIPETADKAVAAREAGKTFPLGGAEIVDLRAALLNAKDRPPKLKDDDVPEAVVLVVRNGVDQLFGCKGIRNSVEAQVRAQHEDKRCLQRGKVVTKHARWNNCYGDASQDADYANGRGTIIPFDHKDAGGLREMRAKLPWLFAAAGPDAQAKAKQLVAETNHYYDTKKCGIGYHGDTERKIVICARLGDSEHTPLAFQWFRESRPVGPRIPIPALRHGDIYIMSEKAVGYDWKKKKILTLRHAAGAEKYFRTKPPADADNAGDDDES